MMNNSTLEFERLVGKAALALWPDFPRDVQEKLFETAVGTDVKFRNHLASYLPAANERPAIARHLADPEAVADRQDRRTGLNRHFPESHRRGPLPETRNPSKRIKIYASRTMTSTSSSGCSRSRSASARISASETYS
jgi:hypothetical protein